MAEPLHVLFIARPDTIHARRWIDAVAERGVRCTLAAVASREERTSMEGIDTAVVLPALHLRDPRYPVRFLANVRALRRTIERCRPDILHAHFVEVCGWLGGFSGFHPWGITAWGSDLLVLPARSRTGIGGMLTRRSVRRADFLTAPSEPLLQAARSLGAPPDRTVRMLWGVDRKRFNPAASPVEWRDRLDVPEGVPLVVSPRRMEALYRIEDILDAWEIVQARGRGGVLALATDGGSLEPAIRERVASGPCPESVRILPHLGYEEMPGLMAAADLVVSVPESDGTPMSVLEALATGTPVIASELPSLQPWVIEGRTGVLVPVGSTGDLADAIERLLCDADLRREYGANASALIAAEADQEIWMDRVVALYRRLVWGEGVRL